MKSKSSAILNKELFESVTKIRPPIASGVSGTTSKHIILQELHKKVAQLGASISADESYTDIMNKYNEMVAALDVAGVTGVVGENEMHIYYKKADDIWLAIEKENK